VTDLSTRAAMSATEPDTEPSALISASVLHLLLAQHPELGELQVEWTIDVERVIRPFMTVRHPDCAKAARMLAAALELDIQTSNFTDNGIPTQSLYVQGRWGGARWDFVAYAAVEAGETA
jgi:hypothetical protein